VLQLCHNAVKFSEPGTTVALGSRVVPAHGSPDGLAHAHVWVRDQGVGIAGTEIDRVFDRFARAETGRGVEGSGLGLSIVSAIAEAHGGRVDVESTLGVGSVFTIVLPVLPVLPVPPLDRPDATDTQEDVL